MITLTYKTFKNVVKSIFKLTILSCFLAVFAQKLIGQSTFDYSYYNKAIVIKNLPFGSFNPTGGLQLGAEYYISENRAIDFQYRFLMTNWDNFQKGDQQASLYPFLANFGYRFISKKVDRFYVMPQLQYKQYTRFYEKGLGYNCDEFGCDYFRTFNWQKQQRIGSAYLITGISGELLNTNLTWDFFIGFGVRFINSKFINEPDRGIWQETNEFREWSFSIGDDSPVDFKSGMSIGYLIKSKNVSKPKD